MARILINWIAKRSEWGKQVRSALRTAENASRKLQQGYRERYVQPRYELDELIRIQDKLQKLQEK